MLLFNCTIFRKVIILYNIFRKVIFMINVTVWNEFRHEREDDEVKAVYPNGIHNCIKDFLSKDDELNIRTATLDEENCVIINYCTL